MFAQLMLGRRIEMVICSLFNFGRKSALFHVSVGAGR